MRRRTGIGVHHLPPPLMTDDVNLHLSTRVIAKSPDGVAGGDAADQEREDGEDRDRGAGADEDAKPAIVGDAVDRLAPSAAANDGGEEKEDGDDVDSDADPEEGPPEMLDARGLRAGGMEGGLEGGHAQTCHPEPPEPRSRRRSGGGRSKDPQPATRMGGG